MSAGAGDTRYPGHGCVSLDTLCAETGLSHSEVIEAMRALHDAGFVEWSGDPLDGSRALDYQLKIPPPKNHNGGAS